MRETSNFSKNQSRKEVKLMRKISFLLVLLAVVMFAASPVMAQTEVIYDNDTTTAPSGGPETTTLHSGPAYFNASAFHAGMSGIPYTSWGFTSGSDPLGSYSIIGLFISSGGSGIGAASLAPAYTTPCPTFLDTNGYNVNGGCSANKYAFDWGNGNAFGTPRTVGNNGHTIVDDMLAKMINGADTFGTNQADYLIQQVEVMFMRDYITNVELMNAPAINQFPHTMSSDMWSLFVDQTIDQDLAWSDGGDSSSFLLSPNPNTPDLKAGAAIRGILSQRFQLGSTSGYTMLGFRTFAAWDPQTNTVQIYSCGAAAGGLCSDQGAALGANGRNNFAGAGNNGNDHAVSQWVASFMKDSDGTDGVVSSISSWYMRENNFKECPTVFPGVALDSSGSQVDRQGNPTNPLTAADTTLRGEAGVGGPCSFTYGAPGPFEHFIPEIDAHPAGGFVPDP
jgi:hypothetical protein